MTRQVTSVHVSWARDQYLGAVHTSAIAILGTHVTFLVEDTFRLPDDEVVAHVGAIDWWELLARPHDQVLTDYLLYLKENQGTLNLFRLWLLTAFLALVDWQPWRSINAYIHDIGNLGFQELVSGLVQLFREEDRPLIPNYNNSRLIY